MKMQGYWNPPTLLVRQGKETATLEKYLEVSYERNHTPILGLGNSTARYLPKGKKNFHSFTKRLTQKM